MTEPYEELLEIADRLERLAEEGNASAISEPLEALKEAANQIGKAWSGSWLGYHANIYYADLEPAPPGAHFSQEWGWQTLYTIRTTTGDWQEYDPDNVTGAIYDKAGDPDLKAARQFADDAAKVFEVNRSDVLSIVSTELQNSADSFLESLKGETEKLSLCSKHEVEEHLSPKGRIMTRDTLALGQGYRTPPHYSVLGPVYKVIDA
jgi:hypothetical protein